MEIFKESDIFEFKNTKMAVHCKTEELAEEFGERFSGEWEYGESFWNDYEEDSCYSYSCHRLDYGGLDWYLKNGYVVKEFKGFNNLETKKTLLEYFMQIHELEEGEEFVVNGEGRHRIVNGETESFEYDNKWRRSFISATDLNLLEISKAEWKPKQNEEYYYINFYSDELIFTSSWNSSRIEERLFEIGLIHKTKEEAEKRLEEIIALNKQ